MAVGSAVLGTAAAGVAVLVAGVVIDFVDHRFKESAEELSRQVEEEGKEINSACELLSNIRSTANKYASSMKTVKKRYDDLRGQVSETINDEGKSGWKLFSDEEKLLFRNTVLLIGLPYKMCGVNVVIDDDGDGSADRVNHDDINSVIDQSVDTTRKIG